MGPSQVTAFHPTLFALGTYCESPGRPEARPLRTTQGCHPSTGPSAGTARSGALDLRPVDRCRLRAHAVVMAEINQTVLIAHIERGLIGKFPQFRPEEVAAMVESEIARFAHRPIREFVPLLIERHATARLAKLESLSPAQ